MSRPIWREEIDLVEKQIRKVYKKRKLCFNDILPIVECIIKIKVAKIGEIGAHGRADLAQEIMAKCSLILEKFNPQINTAFNFFGRCTENFLFDLIRKHTVRPHGVCYYCDYRDKNQCRLFGDKRENCNRYAESLSIKQKKEKITLLRANPDFDWGSCQLLVEQHDREGFYLNGVERVEDFLQGEWQHLFKMYMANSGIPLEKEEDLFMEVENAVWRVVY